MDALGAISDFRVQVARTGQWCKSRKCSKSLTQLGQMLLVGLLWDMTVRTQAYDKNVMLDGHIHDIIDRSVMPVTITFEYQAVEQRVANRSYWYANCVCLMTGKLYSNNITGRQSRYCHPVGGYDHKHLR